VALLLRLEHEPELVVLEVAQAAVCDLRRLAGRRARPVPLLEQTDREPALGGVARDAGAVDPATDDHNVEVATIDMGPANRLVSVHHPLDLNSPPLALGNP
jgi:hypothetical protein